MCACRARSPAFGCAFVLPVVCRCWRLVPTTTTTTNNNTRSNTSHVCSTDCQALYARILAQRELLIDNVTRCDDDFAELYLELMCVVLRVCVFCARACVRALVRACVSACQTKVAHML